MNLTNKHWNYINEGNVHIVIKILNSNYVLRLIKEDIRNINSEAMLYSIDFVNSLMLPMLHCDDYEREEIIELSDEEIQQLTKELLKFRPKFRNATYSIISKYAIKALNLTTLSLKCETNYCIEIKPKEGFLSSVFREQNKCYYCLKQLLKLQEQTIQAKSDYCPLDLFSGDKARMKYALRSLIENPQNNFKLFINGVNVFCDNTKEECLHDIIKEMKIFENSEMFLSFIIEILLNENQANIILNKCSTSFLKTKSKCVEGKLKQNSFLNRILQLQKLSERCSDDTVMDESDFEYVPKLLDLVKSQNLDLTSEDGRRSLFNMADSRHLKLISAIVKDCSLMISFSTNCLESFPTIQIGDKKIPYRISVTDLEPKPFKTLIKRRKTEAKLLEIFMANQLLINGIQPHTETRAKQLEAWQHLIAEYLKATKQSTIDIRESQNSPLFNNASINRKLSQEAILTILEDMSKSGRAAPIDKSKNVWEVYWHSLDEWGNMIYNWACMNGLNNSVCTIFELRQGENTVDEEFHGLDINVLTKALKNLEMKGKCELMEYDDNQGVKFF